MIMRSIKTYLTVVLLLCILLPTGLIGATAYWFVYNGIRENRIEDVGQVADVRYEELRIRLHRDNERGKVLLDTLIAACRYSDAGINACARGKLEQFATINHAVGLSLHSGIESDLAVGSDAISFDNTTNPFLPGQIAATSTSKVNGASLLSLIAVDSASGFSLVTTYSGQELQNIFVGSRMLGQSGETFLSDNQGFFITKPRYPSQQGIVKPISAVPMQRCLHSESNETLDFDYRNVSIIHGFRFVPEIGGGCIMAHIDQVEAFAPLRQWVVGLGIATFLFACSAWLIATMIGRNMAKPIIALTDMAQALSQGDFTRRVSSTSYREIAKLSQLFNSMAGQLDNTISRLKASERELEQKVVERTAELHQRHRRYHSVVQTTGEGFWRVDRESRLLEVNPAYIRLSGYSETELVGMRVADLEAQETPEEVAKHTRKVMQYGTDTFETRHRRKDGSVWDAEVNASFISEDGGYFIGFIRDISERKQAELALHESEELLRTFMDNASTVIFMKDVAGRYLHVNRQYEKLFHISNVTVQGKTDYDIFPQDTADAFIKNDQIVVQSGQPLEVEEHVPHDDGCHTYLSVKFPIRSVSGEVYAVCGVATDITERKRIINALSESRNLLQLVIDTAPVRIFWKDRESRYLGCNRLFAIDAGEQTPLDVIGKDDFQLGWKEQAELYRSDDRCVMTEGLAKLDFEEPSTTPDNRRIWLKTSKTPLRNEAGEIIGVLGV